MKKVLIVTAFKDYPGGVEVVNKYLEEILSTLGNTVEYFTSDINNFFYRLLKKITGGSFITFFQFILKSKSVRRSYDLINVNGEYSFGIKGKAVINLHHGCLKGYYSSIKANLNLKSKLSLMRSHIYQKYRSLNKINVAVSEFCRSDLEKYGIKVDKVIQNGINTNVFTKQDIEKEDGLVCIAGYDYFRKGFYILEKLSLEKNEKINLLTNKNVNNENFNIYQNIKNVEEVVIQ